VGWRVGWGGVGSFGRPEGRQVEAGCQGVRGSSVNSAGPSMGGSKYLTHHDSECALRLTSICSMMINETVHNKLQGRAPCASPSHLIPSRSLYPVKPSQPHPTAPPMRENSPSSHCMQLNTMPSSMMMV
jgi:hypothetical protein